MKKVILSTITMLMITMSYVIPSMAATTNTTQQIEQTSAKEITKVADSLSGVLDNADDFISQGEQAQKDSSGNSQTVDMNKIGEAAGFLYSIFLSAGVFIATVVGIIIGIKFMMAASADERAKWKQTLVVYVIGVVIVLGTVGIWNIVYNIVNGISS